MNMKNKRKKQTDGNGNVLAILSLIILTVVLLSDYSTTAVIKTAAFSAGLALPQGSAKLIENNYNQYTENKNSESQSASQPDVQINQNGQNTEQVSSSGYSTPKDIVEMIAQAQTQFGSAAHDGVILEKKYDSSNATSTYQNITVRNTTPSHSINIQASLEQTATLNITDKSQPTVLIFHTHTTESYEMLDVGWYTNTYSTRSEDLTRNMVRVGDAICNELEKQGIGYIHDTVIHDYKYTGSYDNSRETILKILEENPSIQIVLDVHRDAIHQSDGTRIKPVVTINNKKSAQIMIIAGCEDGKVASFPNWEQNLTFALQLQQTAETLYPGLMRPILFSARKYNMDVVPCSVLIEMGSDSNTLAEAEYSGHLMGKAIAEFVNKNS